MYVGERVKTEAPPTLRAQAGGYNRARAFVPRCVQREAFDRCQRERESISAVS